MQPIAVEKFEQLFVKRGGKQRATPVNFCPRARERALLLISGEKAGLPIEVDNPAIVVFDDSNWNRRGHRAEGIDLGKGGPDTFAQKEMLGLLASADAVILNTSARRALLGSMIRLMVPNHGHVAVIDTPTENSGDWLEAVKLARGGSEAGILLLGKIGEPRDACGS